MDMFGGYGGSWTPNNYNFQQTPTVFNQKVFAVHGEDGAKGVNVAPGCSVILPDDCEDIDWFIEADQYGRKTVTGYPRGNPIDRNASSKKEEPKEEAPVYVTTKEFDDLKSQVDKIAQFMEELK